MPKLNKKIDGCDPQKFSERLKTMVAETGLSQRKISVKSQLNPYIISKAIRNAEIPSMRSLIKIADTLKCSLSYLIGESDVREYEKADPPSNFHERIQTLTKEFNVKYSEVSRDMPFAHNALYEWMRTETIPSLGYMKELTAYFDVSLDYITGRSDVRK